MIQYRGVEKRYLARLITLRRGFNSRPRYIFDNIAHYVLYLFLEGEREMSISTEFKGTIGVGYNNGHSARCPSCKANGLEVWIEVRQKNSVIKKQIECSNCKAQWKIVVPEDPNRAMTNRDLERLGSNGLRELRQKYF